MSSKTIYHPTNYRKNIVTYWRQWYPNYTIPKGHHIHHITPKSICEQEGWQQEHINHPRNLIVLHPDDHVAIHKNRGDNINESFIYVIGRTQSDATRNKISKTLSGVPRSADVRKLISEGRKGNPNICGVNSSNFVGYYKTPKGVFTSIKHLGSSYVARWCVDSDSVVESRNVAHSHFLEVSDVGKTFKEIGYDLLDVYDGDVNPSTNYKMINKGVGVYHTPWGIFDSLNDARKGCSVKVTNKTLSSYCKNSEAVVTKTSYIQSNVLKLFGDCVGKTFEELGFRFIGV